MIMSQVSTNEFKGGLKVEVDGEPYTIISNEFVKPGKGQPFNRVKLKHLRSGRTIERTFKSGEKLDLADVVESKMRLLYTDADNAVFMDDTTFEQTEVPLQAIGDRQAMADGRNCLFHHLLQRRADRSYPSDLHGNEDH